LLTGAFDSRAAWRGMTSAAPARSKQAWLARDEQAAQYVVAPSMRRPESM